MNYQLSDRIYLQRCAQLAALGTGLVLDSPRVGAVLVVENQVIGEGYHQRAGQAHAEVNCLAAVREADRHLIPQATLYVSLEPCCIAGRTGACTDVIQRNGIKTVVFAQRDATREVDGKSVAILRQTGVTVREYPDFNPTLSVNAHRRILTLEERPRVLLKYAQSVDGMLRPADRTADYWITSPISRRLVHRWRTETSAILVGGRTVVEDDPALTPRFFPGPAPVPVILDPRNRVSGKERLFTRGDQMPLVFAGAVRPELRGEVVVIPPTLDKAALTQVLSEVASRRLGQLTVEGGAGILRAFLAAGLWDEARVFTGGVRFGAGLEAPQLGPAASLISSETIGTDLLRTYINTKA
ncbi:MAG: bifunctional diaminohydroxyphosphoribosylaminopyrimidine deaminase/5-amino-6-(5-phosphoribosylamino)uracil reductase RibD [Bacteroidota bacterium]